MRRASAVVRMCKLLKADPKTARRAHRVRPLAPGRDEPGHQRPESPDRPPRPTPCPRQRGATPLHMAAYASRPVHVQLLLEAGADPWPRPTAGAIPVLWRAKVKADENRRRAVAVDTQRAARRANMLKRLLLILALVAGKCRQPAFAGHRCTPTVCLACIRWAEHRRQNGFTVKVAQTEDMDAVKAPAEGAEGSGSRPQRHGGRLFHRRPRACRPDQGVAGRSPRPSASPSLACRLAHRGAFFQPDLRNRLHHARQGQHRDAACPSRSSTKPCSSGRTARSRLTPGIKSRQGWLPALLRAAGSPGTSPRPRRHPRRSAGDCASA